MFTFNTDTTYGGISPGQGGSGLDVDEFSVNDQGSATLWGPANYSFAQDDREEAKLSQFQPNMYGSTGDRLLTLAESIATYGLTRAIDNHFGPVETNKTNAPGSFAGQNGLTYTAQPGQGIAGLGGGWVLPVALVGIALLALR